MNQLRSVSAMRPVRKHRLRDATMRFGVFWPYSRTLIPPATIAERNPDVLDLHNHVRLMQAIEAVGGASDSSFRSVERPIGCFPSQ